MKDATPRWDRTTPGAHSTTRSPWTALPLHSVLLAAFPVLFLFAENAADQLVIDPIWNPLGIAVAAAIVSVAVFVAASRDAIRGGLMASLVIVLFASFGHLSLMLADQLPSRWVLAVVYLVVAMIGVWLLSRSGRWAVPLGQFLNVVAIGVVAFNIVRIAEFTIAGPPPGSVPLPGASTTASEAATRPDVYFLVFDRYANTETLDRIYGFDNEPFLRELESLGFTIARDSWSSYFRTAPSLLSTLSMEYLDGSVFREEDEDSPTMAPINRRLRQGLAGQSTFKDLGYEYIHIGSWWSPTSRNIDADLSVSYAEYSQFGAAFWDTTALSLLHPDEPTGEVAETLDRPELVRSHTLFQFERVVEAMRRPGPTFVFAHFLVPHPPYVFKRDGTMTTADERRSIDRDQLYLDQLMWTNDQVLALVRRALDVPSGAEPVIILQSDEGPYPRRFARDPAAFDWLQATPDEIQEKYGILNALHLPGMDPSAAGIHDRMSPVNTFRIILNEYFGTDLPLLPDRVYLTPTYARMYDFTEYYRP